MIRIFSNTKSLFEEWTHLLASLSDLETRQAETDPKSLFERRLPLA